MECLLQRDEEGDIQGERCLPLIFELLQTKGSTGFFLGQFELAYRPSKFACGSQVAAGHFLARRASSLGGPGACSPEKFEI